METKVQKSVAGKTTGSFINYLMGNNATLPEVGKGATLLRWTDRHPYEVISVSNDGKRVILKQYIPERIDDLGMSDSQQYKYEKLSDHADVIVWRHGAWRQELHHIIFDEKYYAEFERLTLGKCGNEYEKIHSQMIDCLFDENANLRIIEGKTRLKKQYSKVNVLWGVKDEYYDYSF